jgi:hydrogenase expression/formation protein HypC
VGREVPDPGAPAGDLVVQLLRYGACTLDEDGCTTCGDMGIPVRVVEIRGFIAVCEDRAGRRAEVAIDFVPGIGPGDVLLVHMGVAIAAATRRQDGRRGP